LKPTRKRIHAFLYVPEGKGFHIVVGLKNVPGALESLLNLLRQHVDLTNTISYNTSEGKAISSVFAKSLSKSLTGAELKMAISKSPFVEDCEVVESNGGLVVDTFHRGTELGRNEPLLAISVRGLSQMFRNLVRIFGSGGETILFEEGLAVGQANGEYVKELFGEKFVRERMGDLAPLYQALGWGIVSLDVEEDGERVVIKADECFECSGDRGEGQGCPFVKGHMVGIVSAFTSNDYTGEETKCRFRGDPRCEFILQRKKSR